MRGLISALATGCCVMAIAAPAPVQAQERQFNIPAGSLKSALASYGRQSGKPIIYKADDLRGVRSGGFKGRASPEAVLETLLRGTGFVAQRGSGGAIAVVRAGNEPALGQESASSENETVGRAEILVIGQRSSNVDVRRTEDDAQPYVVFDRKTIEDSQATTVEEFLRARLPQNTAGIVSASVPVVGGTTSNFTLRGLSSSQTLILVNGRRLPARNNRDTAPGQADVNGIPVGSIERIEVLPSSAGGIYGGNAVGGVINIILKSDYRGVDVALTYNDTFDFHAPSGRIDINGGFALEGGRTTVTFGGSISKAGTMRVRDRLGLFQRGLDLYRSNIDPLTQTVAQGAPPVGNAVNIRNANNANLVLKPQYGGAALGSPITYIPLGYAGVASDNGAVLRANAGQYNLDIPDDSLGLQRGIYSLPTLYSGNISIRRKFTDWLDIFADYSHFENRSTSYGFSDTLQTFTIQPTSPLNPFTTAVRVSLPLPGLALPARGLSVSNTLTGGTIVRLPYDWALSAEYSRTWSSGSGSRYNTVVPDAIKSCLITGAATCNGGPPLNVFQPPVDLTPFIFDRPSVVSRPARSRFDNPSLRLSGPVVELPGGSAVITAAIQREATAYDRSVLEQTDGTATGRIYLIARERKQATTSQYGELVLPLVSPRNDIPFIRELELRGAIRYDSYRTEAPTPGTSIIDLMSGGQLLTLINADGRSDGRIGAVVISSNPDVVIPDEDPVVSKFHNTSFTLAGRYSPFDGVMFRASYATGFLPPNVLQLSSASAVVPFGLGARDPLRGNELINYPLTVYQGQGNTSLRPETSKTLSFGMILTPFRGLRFSADYTRIRKQDEVGSIPIDFLLANADQFPGRVVRGPASDGFSVGRIQSYDPTPTNLLRSKVEAVDFQFDYSWSSPRLGDFHLYAMATWQPELSRLLALNAPLFKPIGYSNGPLEWRGNAGLDWTRGGFTIRWNTQLYDRYRITTSTQNAASAAATILQQGSEWIPVQTYSDLNIAYDFGDKDGLLNGVRIAAGVQNIFNQKPPVIASPTFINGQTYSGYGDPRLRRFTLTLRKSFGSTSK